MQAGFRVRDAALNKKWPANLLAGMRQRAHAGTWFFRLAGGLLWWRIVGSGPEGAPGRSATPQQGHEQDAGLKALRMGALRAGPRTGGVVFHFRPT